MGLPGDIIRRLEIRPGKEAVRRFGLAVFLGFGPWVLAAPVVLDPAKPLDIPAKDGTGPAIRYQAQPAKDGIVDLTATNGFFDRCFEALGQQAGIPGDAPFIGCRFESLGRFSEQSQGMARWHLWCPEAGEVQATFFMQVPAGEAGLEWKIEAGGESRILHSNASDGQTPQAQSLTFTIKEPGKVTFAVGGQGKPLPPSTRILFIRLAGPAIAKASLLRARWRPAAIHGRFFAPANCPAPKMWVFETADVGKTGSYSPLTTPFGYFGTSFAPGGRIAPGSGFNFSMWIAGRGATAAPPLERMARLIGTDLPGAEYSTFGGEGTGVKFRGAAAYKDGADRTIQALRLEVDQAGLQTYYGYFYDEPEQRWKLYASAQSPGRKNSDGLLASTGSFCEIPGPPNRERSGDLVREIKRRGWFYGRDGKWYAAQIGKGDPAENEEATGAEDEGAGDKPAARPRARKKQATALASMSSQRFYVRDDGWTGMATGGLEAYGQVPEKKPRDGTAIPAPLPEYLSPDKTAQLFDLPVKFGHSRASQVAASRADIDYEILKTGPDSQAILYYGTVDALTYPPKSVEKGSAAEIDMFRPERTWQHATPAQPVQAGTNRFQLKDLKPGTTYHYRLFITHAQGKSWDYHSGQFTTSTP